MELKFTGRVSLFIAMLWYFSGLASATTFAAPILPFASEESIQRLARSEYKSSFFALTNHYKPQENRFFCGITAAVIVLNAMRSYPGSDVIRPIDLTKYDAEDPRVFPSYIPSIPGSPHVPVFERYTETAFFNEKTDQIKTKQEVYGFPDPHSPRKGAAPIPGVTIQDVHQMLLAHDVDSKLRWVDGSMSPESILNEIRETLKTPGKFVIVSYYRESVGQKAKRGHFSPIAAYDADSNSFLIMDVTPQFHGWFWADAFDLVRAMSIQEGESTPRGYVILQEGNPPRKSLSF